MLHNWLHVWRTSHCLDDHLLASLRGHCWLQPVWSVPTSYVHVDAPVRPICHFTLTPDINNNQFNLSFSLIENRELIYGTNQYRMRIRIPDMHAVHALPNGNVVTISTCVYRCTGSKNTNINSVRFIVICCAFSAKIEVLRNPFSCVDWSQMREKIWERRKAKGKDRMKSGEDILAAHYSIWNL